MRSRAARPQEIAALLRELRGDTSLGERLRHAARLLRGRPYVENPLGGGPTQREVLTLSLAGFDCVTYVETVLALALARSARDVRRWLRRIRYDNGRVTWHARHHYMVEWIRANVRQGLLTDLTRGPKTRFLTRRVNVVPGIPPRTLRFRCLPKTQLAKWRGRLRDGDLIFFASTRPNLDVFHVGLVLLEREPGGAESLILSHASRRRGRVVEEELEEFLKENRMSGVLLVRPREPRTRSLSRTRVPSTGARARRQRPRRRRRG
jgi:D-alanyl-D-alanine carboxypeptidase/D-alanyl-D-alanine-endopeptidase (penicillin-binding protein 4)